MDGLLDMLFLLALALGGGIYLKNLSLEERQRKAKKEQQERRRKGDCFELIYFFQNYFGDRSARSQLFSGLELRALVEDLQVGPDELLELFLSRIETLPGTLLGVSQVEGLELPVLWHEQLRARHLYVVGKSGMGKTTLLQHVISQSIEEGRGVGVLAAEDEFVEEEILPFIPGERAKDVVYVNPKDTEYPLSLNPFSLPSGGDVDKQVDETITIFKRLLSGYASGPRMDQILSQTIYALTLFPDSTLLDVGPFLSRTDDGFRREVLSSINDELTTQFFEESYPLLPKDSHLPIITRIGRFIRPAKVRGLLCQKGPALSFREVMDSRGILLINASDGAIGEQSAAIVGQFAMAKFQLAAMSRVDTKKASRVPFTVVVDEFQSMVGDSSDTYKTLFSRARKYGLEMVLSHQQTSQIEPALFYEIVGNASTMVSFHVSARDAKALATDLAGLYQGEVHRPDPDEFVTLERGNAFIKLGTAFHQFKTRPFTKQPDFERKKEIIALSQKRSSLYPVEEYVGEAPEVISAPDSSDTGVGAGEKEKMSTVKGPSVAHRVVMDTSLPVVDENEKESKESLPWVKKANPSDLWGDEDE